MAARYPPAARHPAAYYLPMSGRGFEKAAEEGKLRLPPRYLRYLGATSQTRTLPWITKGAPAAQGGED